MAKYSTELLENLPPYEKIIKDEQQRVKNSSAKYIGLESYEAVLKMAEDLIEVIKVNETKWLLSTAGEQSTVN